MDNIIDNIVHYSAGILISVLCIGITIAILGIAFVGVGFIIEETGIGSRIKRGFCLLKHSLTLLLTVLTSKLPFLSKTRPDGGPKLTPEYLDKRMDNLDNLGAGFRNDINQLGQELFTANRTISIHNTLHSRDINRLDNEIYEIKRKLKKLPKKRRAKS